jgi:hypothetical protein
MAAQVEAKPVAHLGAGQPPDRVLGLQHHHLVAGLGQHVAGGQPGGPRPQHRNGLGHGRLTRGRSLQVRMMNVVALRR